jgi:hypothetical protein
VVAGAWQSRSWRRSVIAEWEDDDRWGAKQVQGAEPARVEEETERRATVSLFEEEVDMAKVV